MVTRPNLPTVVAVAVLVVGTVAVLVVGMVGVGVVGAAPFAQQQQARNGTGATITVSGEGAVTTAPDRAIVYVAVTARGDAAATATDRLATNASRLRGRSRTRT
ncbi:MAG: SIMPL domain-containing protein [Haloarculaceae archaeon]